MSIFGKINTSKQRAEDESYEDYKKRLRLIDKLTKFTKRGTTIYSPLEEVNLPNMNPDNTVKYKEDGTIDYSDSKVRIGAYRSSIFGPLDKFAERAREIIKVKREAMDKAKEEADKLKEQSKDTTVE